MSVPTSLPTEESATAMDGMLYSPKIQVLKSCRGISRWGLWEVLESRGWSVHEWDSVSVQSLSCIWLLATPWTAASQAALSITNSQSLRKLMAIELVMPSSISSSVIPFSSCPQSLPASRSFQMSQLFASGGQSIGVSSFNISPSNEHSGLISFRIEWLDLLAVQGTLKSLL